MYERKLEVLNNFQLYKNKKLNVKYILEEVLEQEKVQVLDAGEDLVILLNRK